MEVLTHKNKDTNETAVDNKLLQRLTNEKLDILYKNLYTSVPAGLFCATIILFAFDRVPHTYMLFYWYVAMVLISCIRLVLSTLHPYGQTHRPASHYVFILTTGLTALLWGLVGSILMPTSFVVEQTIAIIVIAGVTAGGIQSLGPSFLSCLIYAIFSVAPLCFWVFIQNETSYHILGFAISTYLLFLIIISLRTQKFLTETLKMKYENIEKNIQLNQMNHVLVEQENNLRLIHDNAPIGMAIVSLDGKWLNVNTRLCELVGYSKDELEKSNIRDVIYKDDLEIDEDNKGKLLRGSVSSYQAEKRYIRKNGELIWILANISLVRDKEDNPLYFISQIQNINDRKQNEIIISELSGMNGMLQLCHDSVEAYPIITHTAQKLFSSLSGGLAILNKYTNELETVATWGNNALIKPTFNINTCWAIRAGNSYEVKDPETKQICQHFEKKPTSGYICVPLIVQGETLGTLIFSTLDHHEITSYQLKIITNFSEIIKLSLANIHLNEALREQAIHDTLTGLVNRRYLYEWFPQILHHIVVTNNVLSICMIDVDFFKSINDKFGHEAGDVVLKHIAQILQENVRESDIACRYGGEEFVIVLIGSSTANALSQMEKIRKEIKNAKIYTHDKVLLPPITVSIGIAEAPKLGDAMNVLLRAADSALYTAKTSGRDKVVTA